jgi:hypothetical protein
MGSLRDAINLGSQALTGRCPSILLAAAFVVGPGFIASAQMPALPAPGLRMVYDVSMVATGQAKQQMTGAHTIMVTCRKGPFVRIDRVTQGGRYNVAAQSIFYRMLVPHEIRSVVQPGNRRTAQRFTIPRAAVDRFIASGGSKDARFSVAIRGLAPDGSPAGAIQLAEVTYLPLGKERVTVPAGTFEAVVFSSRWVFRKLGRQNLTLVVETRGWVPRDLGYAVRITTKETFTGTINRKIERVYAATRIENAKGAAGNCGGVPAN